MLQLCKEPWECHPFGTAPGGLLAVSQPCDDVSQWAGKAALLCGGDLRVHGGGTEPAVMLLSWSKQTLQPLSSCCPSLVPSGGRAAWERQRLTSGLGRGMWIWGRRALITVLPGFDSQLTCRGWQQNETPAYILFPV